MKKLFLFISLFILLTAFGARADDLTKVLQDAVDSVDTKPKSDEDFFLSNLYGVNKSDKELLRKARKKIMQENSKCVSVSYGDPVLERDKNGKIVKKKGEYYITCDQVKRGATPSADKMPFNVFFTKEDILGKKSMANKPAFEEIKSKRICEEAIMNQSPHPSTVDIKRVLGYSTRVVPEPLGKGNNKRIVYQEFSAKNDFGLKLKYKAECHILPDGKLEAIDISEI